MGWAALGLGRLGLRFGSGLGWARNLISTQGCGMDT